MAIFSAIGKLSALATMVVVFFGGMVGVIYISLQGSEITVPEITGKTFLESERELASLGLKIKKRADRISELTPNTVIEQLPKPGETVKTGQLILVVTSKAPAEGESPPSILKESDDRDDSEKIEEMISDKPKKSKSNSNTEKKKPDTSRDVVGAGNDTNSDPNSGNSNKKEPGMNNSSTDKGSGNTATPVTKPNNPANSVRPAGGDTRPRVANRP